MALTPGTVVVDNAGVVSGSGLARDMFDDDRSGIDAMAGIVPDTHRILMLKQLATRVNNLAQNVLEHVAANAEVSVFVDNTDAGLQTSATAGSPTTPHILPSPIELGTKGTVA